MGRVPENRLQFDAHLFIVLELGTPTSWRRAVRTLTVLTMSGKLAASTSLQLSAAGGKSRMLLYMLLWESITLPGNSGELGCRWRARDPPTLIQCSVLQQ